jgi:hypothetical protein
MPAHFVAGAADQIDEVAAEAQDICRVETEPLRSAIAERFLGAAADDVGRFDDLIADDQQNVAGTIIVVTLSFPMDRGELGFRAATSADA